MSFFGELKRRNVVKVAVAYAIVGWLLIEVSSVIAPALNLPDWAISLVVFFVILGFPLALILSWAYELTPEGMKKSHEVEATESISHVTGRKIDFAIIGALLVAVGFLLINYVLVDDNQEAMVQETVMPAAEAEIPAPVVVEEQREVLPNSVAVLLCDNLSPNPDDAYFAAGIHEEILNQLVKLRNLNVIARTSVLQYAEAPPPIPQIAEELKVGAVMECSVRYAGDAIVVTAQLIDPETNSHLWSDTYPGDLSDLSTVFAMQADIAMNIANAVGAEFSVEEQERVLEISTESPEAYALYLRANSLVVGVAPFAVAANRDSIEPLLLTAIDLDPEFSMAYSLLASVYAAAGEEALTLEAAAKALEIDPLLSSANMAMANVYRRIHRPDETLEIMEQAILQSPADPGVVVAYAHSLVPFGRGEEGFAVLDRALELDPANALTHYVGSWFLWLSGDRSRALAVMRRAAELAPGSAGVHRVQGTMEGAVGNQATATGQLELSRQLVGSGTIQYAYGYRVAGLHDDAVRIATSIGDTGPGAGGVQRLFYHLVLEQEDEAAEELKQWIENPPLLGRYLTVALTNAFDDPILEKPEFQTLLAELRAKVGWSSD